METHNVVDLLDSAVKAFDIELAVLASVEGLVLEIVGEDNKDDFISLYNSSFYDGSTIVGLYENLKVSILPQMVSQGNKYCYLGLINNKYIYGVFGKTDKAVKEQYFFSKEINAFLTKSLE